MKINHIETWRTLNQLQKLYGITHWNPKKIKENQCGNDWMEWSDDDKIDDGKSPMDKNPSSPKTDAKIP